MAKVEINGPATRKELNAATCACPDCNGAADHTLYLSPICHPTAGLIVSYQKKDGALRMECRQCDAPVGAIWVGDGPQRLDA